MTNPSIITIGDTNYFLTIAMSAILARKFHPDIDYYVYDWGLKNTEVKFLETSLNVNVINWSDSFVRAPFSPPQFIGYIFSLLKLPLPWSVKGNLLRSVLHDYIKNKFEMRKEWLLAQKIFVFLYHSKLINGENFLFLDGDAMLISDISELLYSTDFDIHVTLRRKHEINLLQGFCQALNSGVILFSGGPDKQSNMIEEWISQMNNQKFEYLIEQSSLTRLVLGYNKNKINQTVIPFGADNKYLAKVHSCEIYNYNWIEKGFNPSLNKILHFKGGRHSYRIIKKLCAKNELSPIFNELSWWTPPPKKETKITYCARQAKKFLLRIFN